jgi:hypothetical protein
MHDLLPYFLLPLIPAAGLVGDALGGPYLLAIASVLTTVSVIAWVTRRPEHH